MIIFQANLVFILLWPLKLASFYIGNEKWKFALKSSELIKLTPLRTERLTEQMFRPIVSVQGMGNSFFAVLAAFIPYGSQCLRIALSGKKGLNNFHAGYAGDVRYDVVQL